MLLLDVDSAPKKSSGVAEGAKYSLNKVSVDFVDGDTTDSGVSTPEKLKESMIDLDLMNSDGLAESCGLHDGMSCFRLPCEHYIGSGGIDKRNAFCQQGKVVPSQAVER